MVPRTRAGSSPRPEVELAWGSRSMSRIGCPSSASAAPRLMAVVVLPTPPFWLTTAMTAALVVANMLGSDLMADPICWAIRPDCTLSGSGCRGHPAARPERIERRRGQRQLGHDRKAEERADSDADQQVVRGVADAR